MKPKIEVELLKEVNTKIESYDKLQEIGRLLSWISPDLELHITYNINRSIWFFQVVEISYYPEYEEVSDVIEGTFDYCIDETLAFLKKKDKKLHGKSLEGESGL